jgi:hypothetical protein
MSTWPPIKSYLVLRTDTVTRHPDRYSSASEAMGERIAKLTACRTPFATHDNTVTFRDQNGVQVTLVYEDACE